MQSEIRTHISKETSFSNESKSISSSREFGLQRKSEFEICLAEHLGMCFGVRDAIEMATKNSFANNLTILGELVHNEVVRKELRQAGAREGNLKSAQAPTSDVLITAHGASDAQKERWSDLGHRVLDASCPLVKKAHTALKTLVAEGAFPIVIGKAGHAEVEGLVGDFPMAQVVISEEEIAALPLQTHFGIVSQTTQPVDFVRSLVESFKKHHPEADVTFRDTICQPTKNRQHALHQLAAQVEFVIVVGGENSNNSRQLAEKARELGCRAERVSQASQIDLAWFEGVSSVGVTAGTSTLNSCVEKIITQLEHLGGRRKGMLKT